MHQYESKTVEPVAQSHPAYWMFVGMMLTLAVIWLLNGAH
jgi:hypothetical protein